MKTENLSDKIKSGYMDSCVSTDNLRESIEKIKHRLITKYHSVGAKFYECPVPLDIVLHFIDKEMGDKLI